MTARSFASTIILIVVGGTAGAAAAGPARTLIPLEAEFRADVPFPEFIPLWREGWKLQDTNGDRLRYARPDMPLGGYLHAFVRNPSASAVEIQDVSLDGISLTQAIAPEGPGRNRDNRFASSIEFSKLPKEQLQTLRSLGEPVWWKADPFTVPAGGSAEIVVRLRRVPQVKQITVSAKTGHDEAGCQAAIGQTTPRIVSIGLAPGCDRAYIYLRHPEGGLPPKSLLIDGADVTAKATWGSDRSQPIIPVCVVLDRPVREGESHLFEATYPDLAAARASVRVDRPDFVYGMWGGFNKKDTSLDSDGARYLEDLRLHSINTIMEQYGGGVRSYVRSEAGQSLCAKYGIRIMDHSPGSFPNQRYVFLHDEPDAKDVKLESLPLDKRIGTRGQWLVGLGRQFRTKSPDLLQLLNIDNTFKPENWYTYGQLPDIACADPYYQEQMRSVYQVDPGNLAAYLKPTYVYAAGAIYQSACAPKPMHLILHTCRFDMPEYRFRPPTPEEKRVELYYALAAGARGISFWWYSPSDRFHGVGSSAPEMRRLFAEIGRVGAEFRTADPVLGRACPASMKLQASSMLWTRTLLAGLDTLVLVAVNDNIASDRSGTTVRPLAGAHVRLNLPSWLKPLDVFEVTSDGMKDVVSKPDGTGTSIALGRVELTRLILITADATLRGELQQRFDTHFAENARKLAAQVLPLSKPAE